MIDTAQTTNIPGPRITPTTGHQRELLRYTRDPLTYIGRAFAVHGPVVALTANGERKLASACHDCPGTIFAYGPEILRKIATNHNIFHRCALTGPLYPGETTCPRRAPLKRMLTGLFVVNEEEHHWHRRNFIPAFHKDKMESYLQEIIRTTEDFLDSWTDVEYRDIHKDIISLTTKITTRMLFGIDPISNDDHSLGLIIHEWHKHFIKTLAEPSLEDKPGTSYSQILDLTKLLDSEIQSIITYKQKSTQSSNDVLSLLLTIGASEMNRFKRHITHIPNLNNSQSIRILYEPLVLAK